MRPWSVAHRGFSARCTENTIASHRAAIEAGADFVETDARLSADGDIFCIHDPDLTRVAGLDVSVAEASTAALQAVALVGNQRLMSLQVFLASVRSETGILIDVKTPELALVERILDDVAGHSSNANIWLGLRALPQLHLLRERSSLKCVALLADYDEAENWVAAGADALRVWEGEFTEAIEARLGSLAPLWITAGGRQTPDLPGDIPMTRLRRLVSRRVQAILLNDPTMIAEAVREDAP
ncbi:MAG: hypothetical protein Kow00114_16510 [Kiloniellaceae bacterium]